MAILWLLVQSLLSFPVDGDLSNGLVETATLIETIQTLLLFCVFFSGKLPRRLRLHEERWATVGELFQLQVRLSLKRILQLTLQPLRYFYFRAMSGG